MKSYKLYKDSGIEWIGSVPKHWEIVPFKRVMRIKNGQDYKDFAEDDGYPVIGSGGCFAYCSKYIYDGEAILLGRKGTIDRPLYINGKFWTVDTMFYAYSKMKSSTKYMYYQSLTIPFEKYKTATALPSMTQTDLGYNSFCVPPFVEQQEIVSYLDKKCEEIEKAIAKQQKRIGLLQELRQSIISKAVTCGVDSGVSFKESGIEWIGLIPSHWKMMRIKHAVFTNSGATPKNIKGKDADEATIVWVRTTDLTENVVKDSSEYLTKEEFKSASCPWLPKETVLVAMYGGAGTIGKCGILSREATINQALCSLIGKDGMVQLYLFYCMFAMKRYWMKFAASSRKDPNISQDVIRNVMIPVPPQKEQESIVEFITNEIKDVDNSIQQANRRVELLEELKQSIITEAVTGKIKVC